MPTMLSTYVLGVCIGADVAKEESNVTGMELNERASKILGSREHILEDTKRFNIDLFIHLRLFRQKPLALKLQRFNS